MAPRGSTGVERGFLVLDHRAFLLLCGRAPRRRLRFDGEVGPCFRGRLGRVSIPCPPVWADTAVPG